MSDLVLERERRDNTQGRAINFNKTGAGRWYVGYSLATQNPATDSVANAVTYWRWDGSEDSRDPRIENAVAATFSNAVIWPMPGDPAGNGYIPLHVARIVVNLDLFDSVKVDSFYRHHPAEWTQDLRPCLRKAIAHEFGHSVGMLHTGGTQDSSTIMSSQGIYSYPGDGWGRFIVDNTDSVYAGTSRAQFSVRRPHP